MKVRKNIFSIMLICFLLGFGSLTLADEIQKARLQPNLTWDLGAEISYFRYTENYDNGSQAMEETGEFYGIKAAVTGHT